MRRRTFLKSVLASTLGLSLEAAAAQCVKTPKQVEGPFYPPNWPQSNIIDLTQSGKAKGESIIVKGRVVDKNCSPIENALVELWQANHWGRYDHPRDRRNPSPIDKHFRGLGRLRSNSLGRFEFRTIRPGTYLANPEWRRPPHLHFKVWLNGEQKIATQMYFADDPLNKSDLILNSLSIQEQNNVVVPFMAVNNILSGKFEIGILL